ncbi:uncharacterized protein VTP21DRAFT_9463 [Calcarisporiella thermophila]|uniref:uncharacterized protein n=1 Tax=Calcarisporiella thermophila TaxID=911321 RepID=UPI00374225C0
MRLLTPAFLLLSVSALILASSDAQGRELKVYERDILIVHSSPTYQNSTYYWLVHQKEKTKKTGKIVKLATCGGKSIAKVTKSFAEALAMEGSGILGNGLLVNYGNCKCDDDFECFELVNNKKFPYGQTSMSTPLRPFVSIAANDIKPGTKIFVPQLKGWRIPGSRKIHNGCLLVDDTSYSFGAHHIDFFCVSEDNYKNLDGKHHVTKVDIYQGGNCKLQDYY